MVAVIIITGVLESGRGRQETEAGVGEPEVCSERTGPEAVQVQVVQPKGTLASRGLRPGERRGFCLRLGKPV